MSQAQYETITYPASVLFEMVGYKPRTPEVVRFHESKAKLKFVDAAARTSKSYAGAHDTLPDCFPPILRHIPTGQVWPMESRRIWIVAPKYQLAKEFDYLWEILVERRQMYGLTFYTLGKHQNSPDQGHMRIELEFGNDPQGAPCRTILEVRSAAHMQSIQADQADVVLMSEAADQPAEVWEKYVSTRYTRAIFPTTPKIQADWIRKLMEAGENDPLLSIEVFHFDGNANPTYQWERYWREHTMAESRASATPDVKVDLSKVDMRKAPRGPRRQKKNYALQRWVPCSADEYDSSNPDHRILPPNGHDCFHIGDQCWASRDPHFAEQFMGRWTQIEGRVLPFRTKPHFPGQTVHVLDTLPKWLESATHYLSVDHGFDDPCAVGWYAVASDGTVVLYDGLYERGWTPSDVAQRVKQRQNDRGYWLGKFGWKAPPKLQWISGDPQNPNVRAELRRVGLPVLVIDSKRQRDRTAGRLIFQDYLSDDPVLQRPKFYVDRRVTAAIDEFRLLRRKPNSVGEERWVGADHFVDATRYFLAALPRHHSEKPAPRPDPAIEAARAAGAAQWRRNEAWQRGVRWA